MLLLKCALIGSFLVVVYSQLLPHARFRGFPMKAAMMLKNRLRDKINQYRERNTEMVCYDVVGCFALPHRKSPLQKIPEDPKILNTKFFLFTKKVNFSHPEIIYYDDEGKSLKQSSFNFSNPLKLLVHGYMSKWNEKGALIITDTYLKLGLQQVFLKASFWVSSTVFLEILPASQMIHIPLNCEPIVGKWTYMDAFFLEIHYGFPGILTDVVLVRTHKTVSLAAKDKEDKLIVIPPPHKHSVVSEILPSVVSTVRYNCNVVLMDWRMGARGPQYATAAANTEVVGRQLGMLLAKMVDFGLNPKNIHLIGFSLGAHVSGTASESIKQKGFLVGRITGLDAASPLFRNNHFREKYKKLDRSDADFVDIIHTDSSPFITDGFGLWEPIGHVDFFPNGGQEQPGCSDPRGSIVKTHFEGTLTRETACSHIRAFHLFIESLVNKLNAQKNACKFTAFSCPGGLISFEKGLCFPQLDNPNSSLALDSTYRSDIGLFGEDVRGEGVMYFSTRGSSPYCGTQLHGSVQLSQKTGQTRGVLILQLYYLKYNVDFHINIEVVDIVMSGTRMNAIGVAEFNTLDPEKADILSAQLTYIDTQSEENKNQTSDMPNLYIDRIIVRDMYANSWQYCKKDTLLKVNSGLSTDPLTVKLGKSFC